MSSLRSRTGGASGRQPFLSRTAQSSAERRSRSEGFSTFSSRRWPASRIANSNGSPRRCWRISYSSRAPSRSKNQTMAGDRWGERRARCSDTPECASHDLGYRAESGGRPASIQPSLKSVIPQSGGFLLPAARRRRGGRFGAGRVIQRSDALDGRHDLVAILQEDLLRPDGA